MNTLMNTLKILLYIVGVCTYSTICVCGMMFYEFLNNYKNNNIINEKYSTLVSVVFIIGIIGILSIFYEKIKKHFFDKPAIK